MSQQDPTPPKQSRLDFGNLEDAVTAIDIPPFVIDMLLAGLFGYLIGRLYIRCGRSLSNRREFAHNFPLLVVTTMLVISIVKSSVALSLGLVGALSIVRFRAAVKEPEELTYLFFAIAIGLGLGGDQRVITICAFFVIAAVVLLNDRRANAETPTLHMTVSGPQSADLEGILARLRPHCTDLHLMRLDETDESMEVALHICFESITELTAARNALRAMDTPFQISFLDTQGMA
jgi:Domain of unknown function (DUF4956)